MALHHLDCWQTRVASLQSHKTLFHVGSLNKIDSVKETAYRVNERIKGLDIQNTICRERCCIDSKRNSQSYFTSSSRTQLLIHSILMATMKHLGSWEWTHSTGKTWIRFDEIWWYGMKRWPNLLCTLNWINKYENMAVSYPSSFPRQLLSYSF